MNKKLRSKLRDAYLNMFGYTASIKPGIHILNAHYVQPGIVNKEQDSETFNNYLETLISIGCKFMRIEDATKYIANKTPLKDACYVAFSFDDGYEEVHSIIAPILEKHNTNAAYFINSNYISSSLDYQEEYNNRVNLTTKKPLSWDQVIDLHKSGHIIGGHTLDHFNLIDLNIGDVQKQILRDKINIQDKIERDCEFFAWPYGNLRHLSKEALNICNRNYKFVYSSDNWTKYLSLNNQVFNRRHIESFWPKSHIRYFLAKKLSYE